MSKLRILLIYYTGESTRTLSYPQGWVSSFRKHPSFSCEMIDLGRKKDRWILLSRNWGRCIDAVVILHSAFSNSCYLRRLAFMKVKLLNIPKVYFVGNEYKHMPEKITFVGDLGVNLIISMNPDERGHQLYRDKVDAEVACIPAAGFDPEVFYPRRDVLSRAIDLGYRAYESPWYLGHREKSQIAEYFNSNAEKLRLKVDVSVDPDNRFSIDEWAVFLNNCRGQLSSESGGSIFEITDETRKAVNQFLKENPAVDFDTVYDRFFKNYKNPVPIWTISGRHSEAAACKSLLVMIRGRYNDYFNADEHYIPIEKDFSNIDEVMEKFRDDSYCTRMIENAYDVAMSSLRYDKLISKFHILLKNYIN